MMAEAIPLPFDTSSSATCPGRTVIRVQGETAEFAALFQVSVLHVDRAGAMRPGAPVGVCHRLDMQVGYYPSHAVSERETKSSEE
jgi:hypothetical protein